MPVSLATPFLIIARNAQWVLVAGLVGGIAFPAAAGVLRPHIPEMVAVILFISALRIEVSALHVSRRQALADVAVVLMLQLVTPLFVFAILTALPVPELWRDILTVVYAGASISGAPAFAMLMGLDGARAMRLLIIGTTLMPLTSFPILSLLPNVATETSLWLVSLKLLGLIGIAGIAALLFRRPVTSALGERAPQILNGLNTLALAIFVLALMDAIQPVLLTDPIRVFWVLLIACVANLGAQVLHATIITLRARAQGRFPTASELTPAIPSGNRNLALFLAALPVGVTAPWLLFIGCFQVPMYLTPLVMRPLLRWLQGNEAKATPES